MNGVWNKPAVRGFGSELEEFMAVTHKQNNGFNNKNKHVFEDVEIVENRFVVLEVYDV